MNNKKIYNYNKYHFLKKSILNNNLLIFLHLDYTDVKKLQSFLSFCKENGFNFTKLNLNFTHNLIKNSLVDRHFNETLFTLSTADLTRAYLFKDRSPIVGYSQVNKRNHQFNLDIYIIDISEHSLSVFYQRWPRSFLLIPPLWLFLI